MVQINATFATMMIVGFTEILNDGKEGGKCSMGGPAGNVVTDIFLDNWKRRGHNCTLIGRNNFGHIEDGSGVKGAMVKREADFSLFPTEYRETDIAHIDYTIPIYDHFLHMICSYNYTQHFKKRDLIDSYTEFHKSFYIALIFSLAIFIFAWKICSDIAIWISNDIRNELEHARLPSWWIMVCAILDQDQFPKISRSAFAILSICFSLYFFVTIDSYMKNALSVDLVTIEEPMVVRSYQDIIDRSDLRVLFFAGSDEELFFKNSDVGTMEHAIWKKRYFMNKLSAEAIGDIWQPIMDQKMVAIIRESTARGAATFGITKTHELGLLNFRVLETNDETGKFFTNAFMVRKDAHEKFQDFISDRLYRMTQSGIFEWFIKHRLPVMFDGGSELAAEKYMSSRLFLPEPPLPKIRHKNIHKLHKICIFLMISATIVLIYEILHFKIIKNIIKNEIDKRSSESDIIDIKKYQRKRPPMKKSMKTHLKNQKNRIFS